MRRRVPFKSSKLGSHFLFIVSKMCIKNVTSKDEQSLSRCNIFILRKIFFHITIAAEIANNILVKIFHVTNDQFNLQAFVS